MSYLQHGYGAMPDETWCNLTGSHSRNCAVKIVENVEMQPSQQYNNNGRNHNLNIPSQVKKPELMQRQTGEHKQQSQQPTSKELKEEQIDILSALNRKLSNKLSIKKRKTGD